MNFWHKKDMRSRAKDTAPDEPGRAGVRFGRRPDHAVRPPSVSAVRPRHQGDARPVRSAAINGDQPGGKRRFDDVQEEFRTAAQLDSITRRIDDLAQELDRRGNRSANAEIATLKHCLTELSRGLGKRAERKLLDAGEGFHRDEMPAAGRAGPVDRQPSPASPSAGRREPRMEPARGFTDDLPARPRRAEQHWQEFGAAGPSSPSMSRIDGLARDVESRERRAADAEIAAIKRSLAELSREIGRQMEPRLHDADDDLQWQETGPESRTAAVIAEFPRRGDAPLASAETSGASAAADSERRWPRIDSAAAPADDRPRHRRRVENRRTAPRAGRPLDWITNHLDDDARELDRQDIRTADARAADIEHDSQDMPEAGPDDVAGNAGGRAGHFGRRDRHVRDDAYEARLAALMKRPGERSNEERETAPHAHTESSADRLTMSAGDRILPARFYPARGRTAGRQAPSRSRALPFAIAGLAGLLVVAIVVAGTYFVRSRGMDPFAALPALPLFHDNTVAETSPSRATGTLPRFALARLQDLRFPLPELYGVYAINRGKLYELEALPGQAPDPRIATSAAISRPSRTTLSDGHVAFVVYRRDVADNISERVSIRVVAKIRRPMLDPVSETRGATLGETWTIRNVALDFRVAPIDQNKDMVLLRPESPDFTLPSGRYALVIKGQAYDFTVDGTITDPAQCLERVEAANGSFLHECQPETLAAGPLPQETAPTPLPTPKGRRQAEARAYLPEQATKPR